MSSQSETNAEYAYELNNRDVQLRYKDKEMLWKEQGSSSMEMSDETQSKDFTMCCRTCNVYNDNNQNAYNYIIVTSIADDQHNGLIFVQT